MPTTAEKSFIRNRVNMPTAKSSAELSQIPEQIRTRAFFSARVAEAHILEKLRQVSDDYSSGKIELAEAKSELRAFLGMQKDSNGISQYDIHQTGLKHLASHARLNLILEQNRKMAKAAGDYARMYKPANLKMFPYVRYHASVGSENPRKAHQQYDGLIFHKDDPWLRKHWPPWDFGCNCELENLTEEEALENSGKIQERSTEKQLEAASKHEPMEQHDFSFDPANAFDENKLPDFSVETKRQMFTSIRKYVDSTGAKFVAAPSKNTQTLTTVDNLPSKSAISEFIKQNKLILDNPMAPKTEPELRNVPKTLEMGTLSREIVEAFALNPGEDKVFLSRGNKQYGLFHQIGEHLPEMLDGRMLQAIMETLGNKKVKYTLCLQKDKNDYMNIEAVDGTGFLTLIRKGIDGHWEIVDAHCRASKEYKNQFNRV